MSELERELHALASAIEFPPTPELAPRVLERLDTPRHAIWPRRLGIAVAIVAVAVGAAFAVPQARTAILRFLGVGAVRIEFVDRLPEVRRGSLDLGTRIDPDAAPFPLLRSRLLGKPDGTYRSGNVVTLLYGTPARVRVLVTEIVESGFTSSIGKKIAAAGTRVEFVQLRDANGPGVWLDGAPHLVQFPGGPVRLAANTLIWLRGDVTVRLEGALRLRDAISIANSLR